MVAYRLHGTACVRERAKEMNGTEEWREGKKEKLLSVAEDRWDKWLCTGLKVFSVRKRERLRRVEGERGSE